MDGFVHHNDVWASDDGESWELAAPRANWAERAMHGGVVFDDRMWIIGGGVYDTRHPLNTVEDYADIWSSEDGVKWTRVTASAQWPPRRFHSTVVHDGRIWVMMGYHRGNLDDIWITSDGAEWTRVVNQPGIPPRHEPMCLSYRGHLWLMGGYGERIYDDVWVTPGLKVE
jgi:hypothetical protein